MDLFIFKISFNKFQITRIAKQTRYKTHYVQVLVSSKKQHPNNSY